MPGFRFVAANAAPWKEHRLWRELGGRYHFGSSLHPGVTASK